MQNRNSNANKSQQGLKIQTSVKAGGLTGNHNQTPSRSLKVKTQVKSGGITQNHNQTPSRNLKVKTDVKA